MLNHDARSKGKKNSNNNTESNVVVANYNLRSIVDLKSLSLTLLYFKLKSFYDDRKNNYKKIICLFPK